ncbi:hypothetical protein ACP4OV_022388 [Aristida adscensionis]
MNSTVKHTVGSMSSSSAADAFWGPPEAAAAAAYNNKSHPDTLRFSIKMAKTVLPCTARHHPYQQLLEQTRVRWKPINKTNRGHRSDFRKPNKNPADKEGVWETHFFESYASSPPRRWRLLLAAAARGEPPELLRQARRRGLAVRHAAQRGLGFRAGEAAEVGF